MSLISQSLLSAVVSPRGLTGLRFGPSFPIDPRLIPDYAGQTPFPAAQLANTQVTTIGDSRSNFVQFISSYRAMNATYSLTGTNYGQGGATIDYVNGIGPTDLLLGWMSSDIGIGTLICGVNGADATEGRYLLANLQASMTALLKRANSVRVTAGSFSGTWTRDTTGSLAKIGVQATFTGGACTVVGVDAGNVWLRDIVGTLSNGDTITAGSWSAVLTQAVPSVNDRGLIVISETPVGLIAAPPDGVALDDNFRLYAEWLDTLHDADTRAALLGPELTPIRMVHLREYIWDSAWSDTFPMPFGVGYTDDTLHPNALGWNVALTSSREQVTYLLSNYPNQHPGVRSDPPVLADIPDGAASLVSTKIPIFGGDSSLPTKVKPTGWTITTDEAKGQSFEVFGPDTDQGIAITFLSATADGTGTAFIAATADFGSQPGIPVGDRIRAGIRFKVTNFAGDGPAVNLGVCLVDFTCGGMTTSIIPDRNLTGYQWAQTLDILSAAETVGTLRVKVNASRNKALAADWRIEFDKVGFYWVAS